MKLHILIWFILPVLFLAAGCSPAKSYNGLSTTATALPVTPPNTPLLTAQSEEPVPAISTSNADAENAPIPTPTSIADSSFAPATHTSTAETTPPTLPTNTPVPAITITLQVTASQTVTQIGSAPPPTTTISGDSEECIDLAAFYGDVNIPDGTTVRQGDQFEKIWRIRNEGTCAWGAGYALVFAEGINMNAPLENPMPAAAPGDIIEVPIILTAPPRGGIYTGNWEFMNDRGQRFGVGKSGRDWIWVQIAVSFVEPTPSGQVEPEPPSSSTGVTTTSTCSPRRDSLFSTQVLSLINTARSQMGLEPLVMQDQLNGAALQHSNDMACVNYVDHIGSDGSLWYDRVSAQGYANYITARENIRVGNPDFGFTPQYVFDQWNISQVHHDNMLYPDVSEAGVDCVFNPQSEFVGYCTAVFARP